MNYPIEVCFVGASGLVGHELLLLLAHIEHVSAIKAVSRSPMGKLPPRVDNIVMNLDYLQDHAEALKADVFICCLGSTIKKAGSQAAFRKVDYDYVVQFGKIAEKAKAKKLLVISAMGADSDSKIFYNKVKGQMEEALYDLDIPQIELFRPSLILGERKEQRRGEDFAKKLSPLLNTFMIGPLKKYRPIQAETIAKAMAVAALNFHEGRYVYESDEIQNIADSLLPDTSEDESDSTGTENRQNP
ncbi:Aspartate-semialdehyde dehydrogenase [compost metagenome]